MSTQITVRLPEELVAFVDEQVAEGRGRSRADVVARAIARERRRRRADRDLEIIASLPPGWDDELDAMARWATRQPMDID